MTNLEVGKPPFDTVHHVGVVVKDMERAVSYYQTLGIGPFETIHLSPSEGLLRGKPLITTPIIRMCAVGGILIELLQPTDEESLAKEFLKSKGEGIQHIAFLSNDLDNDTEKLVNKGFQVIFSQRFGQGGCVYFDTTKEGGILTELFRPPA